MAKATLIDNNYCKEDNGLIIEESFSYEGYTGYLNFKDQVHQFVDCVIHDRPVSVSSENGAKTVMVCLAAIESLEKNKSIDVISLYLFFSMGIYLLLSVLFEVISKQEIYAYGKIDRSDVCLLY